MIKNWFKGKKEAPKITEITTISVPQTPPESTSTPFKEKDPTPTWKDFGDIKDFGWTCIYCQENTAYKAYLRKIGIKRYGRTIVTRHDTREALETHIKTAHVEQWPDSKLDFAKKQRKAYTEADKDLALACVINVLATEDWGWSYEPTTQGAKWHNRHKDRLKVIVNGNLVTRIPATEHYKRACIRAQNLAAEQLGRSFVGIDTVLRVRKGRKLSHTIFGEGNILNEFGIALIKEAKIKLGLIPRVRLVEESPEPSVASFTVKEAPIEQTLTTDDEAILSQEDETHNNINANVVLVELKKLLPENGHAQQLYVHMTAIVEEAKRATDTTEDLMAIQKNLSIAEEELAKSQVDQQNMVNEHNEATQQFNIWMDKVATAVGYESAEILMKDIDSGISLPTKLHMEEVHINVRQGIAAVSRKTKETILNPDKPTKIF